MIVAQARFGGESGFVAKAGLQLGWLDADVSRSTGIGPIAANVDGEIDATLRQYYGEIGFRAALGSFTYRGSRVTASIGYEGSFSDTVDSYGVRANISIGF